jgi:hypothetical protein
MTLALTPLADVGLAVDGLNCPRHASMGLLLLDIRVRAGDSEMPLDALEPPE